MSEQQIDREVSIWVWRAFEQGGGWYSQWCPDTPEARRDQPEGKQGTAMASAQWGRRWDV